MSRKTRLGLLIGALAIGLGIAGLVSAKDKRFRVIDFDDEVVEGMGKRPLDSVSEIHEIGHGPRGTHLYRKRIGFKTETGQTIHDLRFN